MNEGVREKISMDCDWRFHLGDIPFPIPSCHHESYNYGLSKTGGCLGAASIDFDDSSWRTLDVPHDWVIEGGFSESAIVTHGYRPGGIAWYRKHFTVPETDCDRKLLLIFDGIFRDAVIYLNGHRMYHEPSGYTTIALDISDQVLYGENNVLAVRVDATDGEGWWYEGGGIYRHVWLLKTPRLHFKLWGELISSSVETENGKAVGPAGVGVQNCIVNEDDVSCDCVIETQMINPDGSVCARNSTEGHIAAGEEFGFHIELTVDTPQLWSTDTPALYTLESTVIVNGASVDRVSTAFGIRDVVFDVEKGFLLNGVPTKIKGTCNHQDHAGVGVALPDRLHEFRINRLKEMGSNAWRCAHHPPPEEFLDACDRLGMLVMDETRCMNSTPEGFHQLETMILRDRNHPSIIIWSLGNEENHHQGTDTGRRIIRSMKKRAGRLDPGRQIILAMNADWGSPLTEELDVQGINYFPDVYDDFHKRFPALPVIATESSPAFCTRGVYADDPAHGHFSSYDLRKVDASHCLTVEDAWKSVADRPFVLGLFSWPGFDYHGEPEPLAWPCVGTNMGLVDLCGFPKDHFYYLKSWWQRDPVLHIFPHWNWQGREGEPIDVWCYSNCESVELFLNGNSLGKKKMPRNGHLAWQVEYAPGVITARAYHADKVVMEASRETTAEAVALKAGSTWDGKVKADGRDVEILNVSAVDYAGRTVPVADHRIEFKISGPGRIIGVGNGDPASHDPDKAAHCRLFNGCCQVLVQSCRNEPGVIRVEACSMGLKTAAVNIVSTTL
ncbi:MAG: beta-galactosidase GalA [Kiritimatiellales bacterium]